MTKRPSESVAAAPLAGTREVAITRAPARGAPERASNTQTRRAAPCIYTSNVPLATAVYFVWYRDMPDPFTNTVYSPAASPAAMYVPPGEIGAFTNCLAVSCGCTVEVIVPPT